MKKIIVIMTIFLINSNSFAFQDLESTPRTLTHERATIGFLDAAAEKNPSVSEEFIDTDDTLPGIEEYDRHVTDEATAPKVSAVEIALQKMVGVLIVHYISLRETVRIHFNNIKNIITDWYHSIIK